MDIKLEKYTEELLKGYCDKDPNTARKFNSKINIVKKYSTNVLEDHSPGSFKECKIRDSDPLVNMTDPISKSNDDYENILGNIIEAECKLLDNDFVSLTPEVIKLINFCNKRILEFSKNPIESVENCNFKVKVIGKNNDILFNHSAIQSISLVLVNFLREMIPFRICKRIEDIKKLYDSVINVVSTQDSSYIECKLDEYMFNKSDGNRVCLTNKKDEIINNCKFILDLYDEFCIDNPQKSYIEDLKKFIDSNLYNNEFNMLQPLNSLNFYYLNNPGDGDCLFLSVAKNICMMSNIDRNYPNNKILRKIGVDLRLETCKYMFNNRYSIINKNGTIETNSEAMIFLMNSKNNANYNNLMTSLRIKRNKTLFKNPTNYTLDELLLNYSRDSIDDFTKYCILMAQYSMGVNYFLMSSGEKLNLSLYAGICEIACLARYLDKNIVCVSTSKKDSLGNIQYNVGTNFSHIWKHNKDDTHELPLLIYLRGYKTKGQGFKSDHFELIWPKSLGKPSGVNTPIELSKKQLPLFDFELTQSEYLSPIYDTSSSIDVKINVFNIDDFIKHSIPADYYEELPQIILKRWGDMTHKLSKEPDTLEDPHFIDPLKEIFRAEDTIRIGDYVYTIEYLTRFTNLLEKDYVLKSEITEIIDAIKKTKINLDKPINIDISQPDIKGNIFPKYINFTKQTKTLLLDLIKNNAITKFLPKTYPVINDTSSINEDIGIDIDSDDWIIFGNYYYKKTYLELPLGKKTNKKNIVKRLKQLGFNRLGRPVKITENFDGASEFIYTIYSEDEAEDLQSDILHGLLKKLPDIVSSKDPILKSEKNIKPIKPKKKKQTIKMSTSLKKSCEGKTKSQGGLYKKAFRLALINYVKNKYKGDEPKINKEIKLLQTYTKKSQLELYCKKLI